jgi:hypothetical protein
MIMLVEATEKAVAQARPVLDEMGTIRRVGAYGNGYVAKSVTLTRTQRRRSHRQSAQDRLYWESESSLILTPEMSHCFRRHTGEETTDALDAERCTSVASPRFGLVSKKEVTL